ncbi:MAG: sugar phosphate isomerase/epimerase family protein [Planctomycetota bacterium]|jgi:sugar phosphate isomerase/epimerase
MKFAICNETFQDWPFEKAFAFAAECGYTGVEIAPFTIADYVTDVPADKRAEVRRQADAAGLEIVGLHWLLAKTEGLYLTSPEAEVRRKTAAYLGELAKCCADLGGKVTVFGSPQQRNLLPGVSHDEAMKHAADVYSAAVPALEANGVMIAVEPLAPAETDFLKTAADAVDLISMVGSPHVRLHLDCKAMSSESVPIPELIHQYRDLLIHFHANDPNLQGPGFGDLDFVPILQALGETDYQGWVSVEVFDYEPGIERLARQSIAHMQDCLAKLAE